MTISDFLSPLSIHFRYFIFQSLFAGFVALVIFAEGTVESSAEIIVVGEGHSHQWTIDGKYLSYLKYDTLVLFDVLKRSNIKLGVVPSGEYAWLDSNKILFVYWSNLNVDGPSRLSLRLSYAQVYVDSGHFSIDSVSIDTLPTRVFAQVLTSHRGIPVIPMYGGTNRSRVFSSGKGKKQPNSRFASVVSLDTNTFRSGDLWLIDTAGFLTKRMDLKQSYRLPKMSPDGLKIGAKDGLSHFVVFDTAANELGRTYSSGQECWSTKSASFYYILTSENGVNITASELYRYLLASETVEQLTFSSDKIELYPVPSPNDQLLAYSYSGSEQRAIIEILVLEQ